MLTRIFFARAPLAPGRFAPLPVGAVSAQGAMRDRLLALRGGLLSRCASLFPEAGEQSAWFGGALGGGMHAPELLEAMLLTGAQLGDEELRREALHLCGLVVEHQREDGSFGAPGETFAARGRMLRALCAAYSMSGDKQLLTFMLRYMKYLHDTLRVRSLSAEDAMHTADTMEAGILLYNITGQKAILSVLMMLVSQGADYTSLFHAFPYRTPISRSFTAQELLDALAHEDESGYTHHLLRSASGANLCEGLRVSALCGVLTGSGKHLSAPEAGLARLNKAHGAAGGGVTADPLLGGTHPSRGVSAVSACELAASLETLLACPGGEFGADQLETLMYNTIDAAFSPDGRGVQPMQQANQAMLSRAARFPLCGEDAGLFSLEDGDALCSLLSAWPRFVQAQWMISRDDGLCAMGLCTLLGALPPFRRIRAGRCGKRLSRQRQRAYHGSYRYESGVPDSSAHSRMGKRRDRRRGWRNSPRTGGRFRHPQPRLAGWRRDSVDPADGRSQTARVPSGGERRARPAPLRLRAQNRRTRRYAQRRNRLCRRARRRGGNPRGGTHGRFRRACRPRRAASALGHARRQLRPAADCAQRRGRRQSL